MTISETTIKPSDFEQGDSVVLQELDRNEGVSAIVVTPLLAGVIVRKREDNRLVVLQLDGISSGGIYKLVSHTKVKS